VDPATHALTSLALVRGFFPRRPLWFVSVVALAGAIADLDWISALVGPAAYLVSRQTFTHSILGTLVVIAASLGVTQSLRLRRRPLQKAIPTKDAGIAALLIAAALAAVTHVLMDLGTSAGVTLLWPWRSTRFAWDWLPQIDPWILALLLAGILLPELFGLVGSEIGAKDKTPRGRNGAIVALALVLLYVGARATLHGNAVAQLDARTYRGESPRLVAAFADPVSLMTWHGLVETSTQICSVRVPATEGTRFDPESGLCVHKPEISPALMIGEQSVSVEIFLQSARFPKASVGTAEDGTEVAVHDLRDSAENSKRFAVGARVLLNSKGQVKSQEILWASQISLK
jgi:inner membrane protein